MTDNDILVDMAFNNPDWEWIGWGLSTGDKLISDVNELVESAKIEGLVSGPIDSEEIADRIESERL